MTVLRVKNMTLRFGVTTVLEGVDFAVEEGDRVGVIGVNGSGKSSLFRVLTSEYEPESGSVSVLPGKTVGMLSQDGAFDALCEAERAATGEEDGAGERRATPLSVMLHANPAMLRDEARLAELEAAMNAPDAAHAGSLIAEYTALHDRFVRAGGLEYRGRCASLLRNLGFDAAMQEQSLDTLSGGQRTRLALALHLSREPDILLLDEPTNHLDIETTRWLENYLLGYKKTVLVISHDRYFLDRVTGKTLHVEHHHAKLYDGGYTKSMEQRRLDREIAEKHWREQQKEIARQEAYIAQQRQWNRERNIIAAESRLKLLDKMERLERPQNAPRPIRMKFTRQIESGNDVLTVRDLTMRFGERTLFTDLTFQVKKKQRVLLIGPNGCGKSTLIKLLLGRTEPTAGLIEAGYHVEVGYYDQENQNLTDENTVLEELWSAYPTLPETQIRNTLALFRFIGEDVYKTVAVLSGGERARLTLSKLILSHMNLLILDEPTNHLDIDSREALEAALEQFDGTLFVVSHDRYFINKLATRILEMKPGDAFPGDLLDFAVTHPGEGYAELEQYKEARMRERENGVAQSGSTTNAAEPISAAKQDYLRAKQAAADERRRRNRLEKLRAECATLEAELSEVEAQMNGDAASDYRKVAELDEHRGALEDRLLADYEEIEELERANGAGTDA